MSTQVIASATGKYRTICKLCGKAVAESLALDLPVVGTPNKRTRDLIEVLMKHLGRHHKTEFAAGIDLAKMACSQEFIAFLILSTFHHQDPSVQPRLEVLRVPLFAVSRQNLMPDPDLKQLVAALGLSPDDDEKVFAAMRAVRDACCEFGQFAPTNPLPSLLVTP